MTPTNIFDICLARAGIHDPNTPQYDRVRAYFNIIKTEFETLADWRFLYKVATLTTVASQRAYDLASNVLYPLQFWDKTNNRPCTIRNPEDVTNLDADENQTGEGIIVAITGRDATTGYWEVDVYPTPDTASEAIKYRYKAFVANFTSSDDSTDLASKYPAWAQNAILWGTSAAYLEETNESKKAMLDWEKYKTAIAYGIKLNSVLNTPPRFVLGETRERIRGLVINAEVTPD